LSASEFLFWQEYFSYFPFSEDRADRRFAMLASVLSYVEGRTLKQPIPEHTFVPDYLGERKPAGDISLEQQERDMARFAAKLKAMQGRT
jgi:hypothetical protein